VSGNKPALNSRMRRLAYASSSGVHLPRRSGWPFFLDVVVEELADVLRGAGEVVVEELLLLLLLEAVDVEVLLLLVLLLVRLLLLLLLLLLLFLLLLL